MEPDGEKEMKNNGPWYAVAAYLLWGFMPIYLKQLQDVPAVQILLHRVVWSFLFLALIILLRREGHTLLQALRNRKVVRIYFLAAVLLAANWLAYIWGVNSSQIVETSLGYYINPLVSVSLSVIFLKERLRVFQWASIGLAAVGVLYLTLQYGRLPWLALIIAGTFGLYGLMKKLAPLGSLHGLTMETAVMFLPALGILLWIETTGSGAMADLSTVKLIILACIGVVTAVPLLFFASAARRIPLSLMGILQYLSPTTQFLLGIMVYNEPFSYQRLIGFAFVWMALLFFWLEGQIYNRTLKKMPVQAVS